MRADEDLAVIFTWQEDRSLSKNLTLNYQRVTYLIEPGPTTLPLGGHRVRVYEDAEGHVTIRHGGTLLASRPFFDQQPMVRSANIVEHKRLSAVLLLIQAQQRVRDQARLANPHLTLRQKARIRVARAEADAPPP